MSDTYSRDAFTWMLATNVGIDLDSHFFRSLRSPKS